MFTLNKNLIIIFVIALLSAVQSFIVYASEDEIGPGKNIESRAEWLVDTHSILGSYELWAGWTPIHFGTGVDARLKPGDTSYSDIIYANRIEEKYKELMPRKDMEYINFY